jgi:hypothetical protein
MNKPMICLSILSDMSPDHYSQSVPLYIDIFALIFFPDIIRFVKVYFNNNRDDYPIVTVCLLSFFLPAVQSCKIKSKSCRE